MTGRSGNGCICLWMVARSKLPSLSPTHPQVARQPVFEPLFVVTNPFFNIFRGLIPPIAGLDLSPLPAFFLLSFLTNATETMGAELAPNGKLPSLLSPLPSFSHRPLGCNQSSPG